MNLQDFNVAVLAKLEIVGQGQTSTPTDSLMVTAAYLALHQLLTDESLVDWADTDDIPQWAESIMVRMTACQLLTEFGIEGVRAAQLMAEGGWALPDMSLSERQLRKHQALPYISKPAQPDYF